MKPSSGSSEEAPATKQAPRKEAPRKEAPKKPTKQRPGQGSSTQDGKAAGPRINRGGNGAPQPNEPAKTRKANKSPAQEPEEVSGKDQKPQGKSKFGKNGKFPSPGPKQDPREKKQPTDDGMRGSESAAKEAPAKGKPKERPGNSEARKQPEPQQRNQKPRTKKEVSTKKPQEDPAPAAEDGNDGPTTESFKWYKGSEKTPTNYVQDTKSSWVSKFKGKYVPEEEESE